MLQEPPRSFQGRLKSSIFCFTARGWPVSPQALSISTYEEEEEEIEEEDEENEKYEEDEEHEEK